MPLARRETPVCPTAAELERLAASADIPVALRAHIDGCERCRTTLAEIRDNNEFLSRLSGELEEDRHREPLFEETPADAVPGYRILEEIHRGAQGVVYKAVQERTHRTVAVKMLLQGSWATPKQRLRMEREAEIAAALRHPNIVTIYDSVALKGGRYAIAMEYIEGLPVDSADWGTAPEGSLRAKLRAFSAICDAVHFAHQRGVIHRDLKPANILLDAAWQPHVLDFGIAKVRGASSPLPTMTGEFAGTLAYASPEQVRGKPDEIDTRSDVYALGVIFYELLTGGLPYPADGSVADIVRNILEAPPNPPSSRSAEADEDLETIALRALDKDKERRYQSAADLRQDIEHYLAGEPIGARRDSTIYVLKKLALRHKLAVGVTAGIILLILGSAIVTAILLAKVSAADKQKQIANQKMGVALTESNLDRARLLGAVVGNVPDAEDLAWAEHIASLKDSGPPEGSPASLWVLAEIYRRFPCAATRSFGQTILASTWLAPGNTALFLTADGRVTRWNPQTDETQSLGQLSLPAQTSLVALSPGGDLAACAKGRDILVYNTSDGSLRHTLSGHTGPVLALRFGPARSLLASGGEDATARLWDAAGGRPLANIDEPAAPVSALCFDATGRLLGTGELVLGGEPKIRVHVWRWQAPSDEWFDGGAEGALTIPAERLAAPGIRPVIAISRDGTRFAASVAGIGYIGTKEGGFQLAWDSPAGNITALEFSPGGTRLAGCSDSSGVISLWDPGTGLIYREFSGHRAAGDSLAFAGDDSLLTTDTGGAAKVWEVANPMWPRAVPRRERDRADQRAAPASSLDAAAFLPNSHALAVHESATGLVRLYSPDSQQLLRDWPAGSTPASVPAMAATVNGHIATLNAEGNSILFLDPATGGMARSITPDPSLGRITRLFASPATDRMAWTTDRGLLCISADGASTFNSVSTDSRFIDAAWSPDGHAIITVDSGHALAEIDTGTMKITAIPSSAGHAAVCVAVAPDNRTYATGGEDAAIMLRDLRDPSVSRVLKGHARVVSAVSFSPDGRLLASAERGPLVRIWDPTTLRPLTTIPTGAPEVRALCWASDGTLLATAGGDWKTWHASVWDLAHHFRHVAGNAEYQIQLRAPRPSAAIDAFLRWARDIRTHAAQTPSPTPEVTPPSDRR